MGTIKRLSREAQQKKISEKSIAYGNYKRLSREELSKNAIKRPSRVV